ncbi:MAG: hypothetical protein JMM77_02230 [Candidatus Xiphinematobacter sp.]|nr:MAG: hypothetical protein JMM77_02230 [Candidatus Xiphinematobacter sp.]
MLAQRSCAFPPVTLHAASGIHLTFSVEYKASQCLPIQQVSEDPRQAMFERAPAKVTLG